MKARDRISQWKPRLSTIALSLGALIDTVKSSQVGMRMLRGGFWCIASSIASRGLMLVSSIMAARLMGAHIFGELGMIQNTVSMFQAFASLGLGLTATKYVAEFRDDDPAKTGRILAGSSILAILSGTIFAGMLAFAAPWLASRALATPQLTGALRVGAILLFFAALSGTQSGALAGFEDFKTIAGVGLISGIATVPLVLAGIHYGGLIGGLWGLVGVAAIGWLSNELALIRVMKHHGIHLSFLDSWLEWRILSSFSLPALLSVSIAGPVTWACNAILVNQPNGYAEMGIYNAIMRLKQVPDFAAAAILTPVLPILSQQYAIKNFTSYNRVLTVAFLISLVIIGPFALFQAAFPRLSMIPFGSGFKGASSVVHWLMLHSMLLALFTPMTSVVASMGRMWFGTVFSFAWGMLYLTLSFVLIPLYGASGLAASFATAHLVTSLPALLYIYGREQRFIEQTPIAQLSAIMLFLYALAVYSARRLPSDVASAVGTAVLLISLGVLAFCGMRVKTQPSVQLARQA